MKKILACIDGRGNTDAVTDWAAWTAVRLGASLEFLHVLERHPEHAQASESGRNCWPMPGRGRPRPA